MNATDAAAGQKLLGIAPYLVVQDVVASAEFYRDRLGFRFDRYWGEPPSFVMVHRDAVIIMLKGVGSLEAVRPNRGKGQDTGWDAYIWVKDADALYEEFRAKGAQVARTIENQPYGCRDFDILDNSGYTLCFGQDIEG